MFRRWNAPAGYRDVLRVSLPLVVSFGSITLMQFTDRLFLGNYSLEAIAAAMPAGIVSFLFLCLFMGTAEYVGVFIAQYTGMGKPERVGDSLWQGIHFALGSTVFLLLGALLAEPIFAWSGHPPEVQELEVIYFRILMLGNGLVMFQAVFSCFYSGRGLTRTVMLVNLLGALVNIPLDYAMINGFQLFGFTLFPEMGIAGAGLATVIAWLVMTIFYMVLLFSRENERCYKVRSAWRFDRELFGRLMRFGLPGGVHFFLDIFSVTFFIYMIGRLGTAELAATNIVFALNSLAFMPMVGFSVGVSVLVGQALGRETVDEASYATWSTLHMVLGYMLLLATVFVFLPEPLLRLFQPRDLSAAEYAPIMDKGVLLLRLVALYSLFDAMVMVFYGVLKGAGDSRFVMFAIAGLSLFVMVLPVTVAVYLLGAGLITLWVIFTCYIVGLAVLLGLRYRAGVWKNLRVVGEWERVIPSDTCGTPDTPTC